MRGVLRHYLLPLLPCLFYTYEIHIPQNDLGVLRLMNGVGKAEYFLTPGN